MFGREQEQAGILIEPTAAYSVEISDDSSVVEFRNKIWYAIYLSSSSIINGPSGLLYQVQMPLRQRTPKYSRR